MTSWIWFATAIHLVWGTALILFDNLHTTTIDYLYVFLGAKLAGIVLIIVGLAAATSVLLAHKAVTIKMKFMNFMLSLPQQFALTLSAGSAWIAIWKGAYADGVLRPHVFILCDQFWIFLVVIFHTLALIRLHSRNAILRKILCYDCESDERHV